MRGLVLHEDPGGVVDDAAEAGGRELEAGEGGYAQVAAVRGGGGPGTQRAVFEAVAEDQVGRETLGEHAEAVSVLAGSHPHGGKTATTGRRSSARQPWG